MIAPICVSCWETRCPDQDPERRASTRERCFWCGTETTDGIVVGRDGLGNAVNECRDGETGQTRRSDGT